jgi:FixJ family two-component response regulator
MTDKNRTVHIVDDDEAIRQSVGFLLRKAGYAVETYPAGTHFLKSACPMWTGSRCRRGSPRPASRCR